MSLPACHGGSGAPPRPACELADVVRRYGTAYRRARRLPYSQHRVLNAIERCRTAALGGHREWCAQCGFERYAYNSCRNRHCPKCQALVKAQWLEARQAELLPVPYFHNVFTLPHQLNGLILCHEDNQRALLNLLFQAAAQTLLQFGRNNLGGTPGITMVLHTWDQQLRGHFHVHCLITGGALSLDQQRWRKARPKFLFPVRALSMVFRGKFLDGLRKLYDQERLRFPAPVAVLAGAEAFAQLLADLRRQGWVVYSKAPFAGPQKLLDYLGRYTHRVAISNNRLLSTDDGQVRFRFRDRAAGNQVKVASLPVAEFIRRFLLHVLPSGLQRIRHYGLLASRNKEALLARCRELLGADAPPAPEKRSTADWLMVLLGIDALRCPRCSQILERTELPRQDGPAALRAIPVPEPPTRDTS
jgi:Putative transposase/Transposase zinc-binding domain